MISIKDNYVSLLYYMLVKVINICSDISHNLNNTSYDKY